MDISPQSFAPVDHRLLSRCYIISMFRRPVSYLVGEMKSLIGVAISSILVEKSVTNLVINV